MLMVTYTSAFYRFEIFDGSTVRKTFLKDVQIPINPKA